MKKFFTGFMCLFFAGQVAAMDPDVVMEMGEKPVITVPVIFLGDSGVGKTALFRRLGDPDPSTPFTHLKISTIGVGFCFRRVERADRIYEFKFIDTAGQERYFSLPSQYYRDAKVAIFVVDIGDAQSFNHIRDWILRADNFLEDKKIFNFRNPADQAGVLRVIVANKTDHGAGLRQVSVGQVRKLAEELGYAFVENTSTKVDGANRLLDTIVNFFEAAGLFPGFFKAQGFKVEYQTDNEKKKDDSGCCTIL